MLYRHQVFTGCLQTLRRSHRRVAESFRIAMPSVAQHRRQLMHNRKVRLLLTRLAGNRTASPTFHVHDWIVTLLFYQAVHAVESYLVRHYRKSSGDHRERKQRVHSTLPAVYSHYKDLFDLSIEARYGCVQLTDAQLSQARKDLAAILKATR